MYCSCFEVIRLISSSRYSLDKEIITNDLSKERPLWILSAYGPGKLSPLQLFGGPLRELSFEELRLRHYELASIGNEHQAIQEAQIFFNSAQQEIQLALGDVDGAIRYIINGENEHPNRNDICKAKGANPSYLQGGGGNNHPSLAFGQPSTLGKPAFQILPQEASTFNRPSTSFGQPSVPAPTFGAPSSLGQQAPQLAPAFGRPSALENSSSFGRPSSTFGQPNSTIALGAQAPSSLPSTGQFSNQSQFSTLQAVSTTGATQPAASAFSQPNTFGQPSVPATASGFGQFSSSGSNAFGRPTAPASTNTFGQPTIAKVNPFPQTGNAQTSTSFSQDPTATMSSTGTATVQASNSQHNTARRDPQGKLITWKGKPVSYIDDEPCFKGKNNSWEKIWFPDGPPVFTKAVEIPDEDYDQATKEGYKFLGSHGVFKDGILPSQPPRREWCTWDF